MFWYVLFLGYLSSICEKHLDSLILDCTTGNEFYFSTSFITLKKRGTKDLEETDLDYKDQLIRAMQEDLNRILAKEAGDVTANLQETRGAMNVVLAESVRTQRLYFIVRSVIMSLISALIYFIVVLYMGQIDAVQAAFLGVFVFVVALVVSRLFDKQIVIASKKIIRFLIKHERLRTFILKKF